MVLADRAVAALLGVALLVTVGGCGGRAEVYLVPIDDDPVPLAAEPSAEPVNVAASPTTTTRPPDRAPIVIAVAGDTSFTHGLEQRDPFGGAAAALSAPDLMVVNLETAVADEGVGSPPVQKQFLFRSPPESLDLLVAAGVDVVGLANNHTLDYGADALAQTLDEIDARPLRRVGAGLTEADAYEPLVVDVGQWRVGLVALARVPCDWSASGQNSRPQVAWACPAFWDQAETMVNASLDQADVTIVMVHGGTEGDLCPADYMTELERSLAEMGVDAVINAHPHVLQGLARSDDTWIAHSLGNFAFPSASGLTGNSAIVQLVVTEDGNSLSVVPIRSDSGVLSIPSESVRAEIIGQVNRYSQGVQVGVDGDVRVDPDHTGDC